MTQLFQTILNNPWFERIINCIIIYSGIQLGIETFPEAQEVYGIWFDLIDDIIMFIFAIELFIRLGAQEFNLKRFLGNGWNVLDALVVILPLIPIQGHYQTFSKAIRVFRILRLLRMIPELQLLMQSISGSIRYIISISLLLGLFFYAYSVAGVVIFGGNDVLHFHDLSTSMITMFRVVTLEDWTDIMYINMFGCDVYGYEIKTELCTKPQAYPIESAFFFISFVCLGTMIFLNLFIAVIVESIGAIRESKRDEELESENREILQDLDSLSRQLQELRKRISNE